MPLTPSSFEQRLRVPSAWFGMRDSQLDELTGVEPGATFVHHSGFTGGHKTQAGAIAMVVRALNEAKAAKAKEAEAAAAAQ